MAKIQYKQLVFDFTDTHGPEAKLSISFQRTLRIPDDGKTHRLPPSLGQFPLELVDDYAANVPEKWLKRGGIMLPLHQSEALWMRFSSTRYPFAIKVAAGKVNAVNGELWDNKLRNNKKKGQNYVVTPIQPWLDGFCVAKGKIKQFVAMPLGDGFTVEEQVTGKAEFGGLQFIVVPMKRKEFDDRFGAPARHRGNINYGREPEAGGYSAQVLDGGGFDDPVPDMAMTVQPQSWGAATASITSSVSTTAQANAAVYAANVTRDVKPRIRRVTLRRTRGAGFPHKNSAPDISTLVKDMGLAQGGSMRQEIYADPYGKKVWDTKRKQRCYVHFMGSAAWRAVTGKPCPTLPRTAAEYTNQGLPWFDYYDEGAEKVKGSKVLKGVKSVKEVAKEKGVEATALPENVSVDSSQHVVTYKVTADNVAAVRAAKGLKPGQVREGHF